MDNKWQFIKSLFLESLDKTPTQQRQFLQEKCQEDKALQLTLERLLRSYLEAEKVGFLQKTAWDIILETEFEVVDKYLDKQ